MKRYPWYSVDSTSWVRPGSFGSVAFNVGTYSKIAVTIESLHHPDSYYKLKPHDKNNFLNHLEKMNYNLTDLQSSYKYRHMYNIESMLDLCKNIEGNKITFQRQQLSFI